MRTTRELGWGYGGEKAGEREGEGEERDESVVGRGEKRPRESEEYQL